VHIVRDPFVLFPSTVKLWKRFQKYHGAQVPRYEGLEEQIFARFNRVFEVFQEDCGLIEPGHFCEVKYEDLVRDPMAEVQAIYEKLNLGDFESVRPALEQYVAGMSDYQTNRYEIPPELQREISTRWAPYIEKYNYAPEPAESSATRD
jgi:hypothetical protein